MAALRGALTRMTDVLHKLGFAKRFFFFFKVNSWNKTDIGQKFPCGAFGKDRVFGFYHLWNCIPPENWKFTVA